MNEERERLWRVVDDIQVRNKDKTSEEVERDVAEAIAEVRAARGA